MELDIEGFQARTRHARIYGEMNFVTSQRSTPGAASRLARRYTTREVYRAAAFNLLHRGADGLSLFNFDYVPKTHRVPMTATLQGITDVDRLRTFPKNYVVTPGFGTFPATDAKTLELIIPDDTAQVHFERAALRIETRRSCADLRIVVRLNTQTLAPLACEETELFAPLARNEAYPERAALKFYTVPPAQLLAGRNRIEIENLDRDRVSCQFRSLELALYR
jgi:hypothetical protein